MSAIRFTRDGPVLRIASASEPIGTIRSERRGSIRISRLGQRGRDGASAEVTTDLLAHYLLART
ncbi:MAG TPA: hypothetical protein VF628_11065 [Allosphingosinicella sp.]|jgi:hypothetical protein